jgi:hypothetical protein
MKIKRLADGPIITPEMDPSIGVNIQGPSMIRVPDWVDHRFGDYYLYFADHKGSYIRLAYADRPTGPWAIHPPGSLHLAQSHFLIEPPPATPEQVVRYEARLKERGTVMSHDALSEITTPHIASPDVHVDAAGGRILMYFHGLEDVATQVSRVAVSRNGIDFEVMPEIIGPSYMRVFPHDGMTYALAMPGQFFRSRDGLHGFEPGPVLFNPMMRHSAVLKRGKRIAGVLDSGRRGTGAHSAQPHRYRRGLVRVEGKHARRGAAARTVVGGRRRAAHTVAAQHCLRPHQPTARSGDLRGSPRDLPALCGGGRKRCRHS